MNGRPIQSQLTDLLRHSFIETMLVSALFYLVFFGLLVVTEVTTPTPELVFIALVPFLVLLISSGRIEELGFGDISMKFQQAIQGDISFDIAGEPATVEPEDVVLKGGEPQLDQMIDQQSSTVAFTVGRSYSPKVVQRYLERNLTENPNFQYVLANDPDGRFRGYMNAAEFVSYVWLLGGEEQGIVDAIRNGEILDAEDIITTRIQDGSTLGEAKRKIEAVDVNSLAVVDANDRFVGVLTYEEVTSRLLARLTNELEQ